MSLLKRSFSETLKYAWPLAFLILHESLLLQCPAQAPSTTGWPVKWTIGPREVQGVLAWNAAEKSLRPTTPDGQTAKIPPGTPVCPRTAPPNRPQVQEFPDRTIAILGYQERLTGRLQSIFRQPGQLQWIWPAAVEPAVWNPASASAWLFHPDLAVLSAGAGLEAPAPGDSSRVPKTIELKSPTQFAVRPTRLQPGSGRLWQVAFQEPDTPAGPLVIQAAARVEGTANFPVFLQLTYSADQTHWQLALKPDTPADHTPIARRPGWHLLSLLVEKGRSRVCIDEAVLAETRTSLLPDQPIAEFQMQSEPGQARLIQPPAFFAFQSVPPVIQRPLKQDLLQIDGGHELIGESRLQPSNLPALRAWLPAPAPAVGRWASGPVALVTFRGLGSGFWNLSDENDYLLRMGLLNPPPKGFDRVEGAIENLSASTLTLALSQGGSLNIPLSDIESLIMTEARGVRLLEARPHHLGDEIDMKVIPPEPEGNKLAIAFDSDAAHAAQPTAIAVDVLQVLGANIAPFIDSIARGELITELWLNQTNLGTLNSQVKDRNETPQRLYFNIPPGTMRAGTNQLEFRQKGQKNDPNYLDDLSILGLRLYQKSQKP